MRGAAAADTAVSGLPAAGNATVRTVGFDLISTLIVSIGVFFLGRFLVGAVPVLRRLNIPAPVVGGGVVACCSAGSGRHGPEAGGYYPSPKPW